MARRTAKARIDIKVGDVIDLVDSMVTQERNGTTSLRIRLISENRRNSMDVFAPEECKTFIRGRITKINEVAHYRLARPGIRWRDFTDAWVELENAFDAEPDFISECSYVPEKVSDTPSTKEAAPKFEFGGVNNAKKES